MRTRVTRIIFIRLAIKTTLVDNIHKYEIEIERNVVAKLRALFRMRINSDLCFKEYRYDIAPRQVYSHHYYGSLTLQNTVETNASETFTQN